MSERPKVQHSKCCVVSQPPWVQIPALPPLPPGPDGAGRFCYAWMVCGRVCACCGMLLVFWAPSGLAACVVCLARPGCLVCPWAVGYLADGLVCGAAGVPGAGWCALLGRAAWCARGRWATWLMVLLVVLLVFQVPSGPTAREIATREPAARSGRSRSPPWPSGPSGTLHTGGACVAVTSPARPRPWEPQPCPLVLRCSSCLRGWD